MRGEAIPLGAIEQPGKHPEGDPKPPIKPPEDDSEPRVERAAPEQIDARPGMLEAELERLTAETERFRTETRSTSMQIEAEIADRARRTAAEMTGLESRDRTTEIERYFFMVVVALGVVVTIVLAFMTAEQAIWEYRLSPVAGMLVSVGGSVRLRALTRAPTAHSQGRRNESPGEAG